MIAFSYFALFNLLDLSSTILALKLGLSEANQTLLLLASRLGLGFVDAFLAVKILLFLSMGSALILGVKSGNASTRKIVFLAIAGFAVLFAAVSLNNFLTIFSLITVQ
ncbi:MAG: hypothetical protein ACHQ1H_00850 [Nitrososphaerales archaeon]